MTREEFAERIHWNRIIWPAGIANIAAMLFGLYSIVKAHSAAGTSLPMMILFCAIQIAFSLQGYFKRDSMLNWCMGLSAGITATIIGYIIHLR